MKNGLVGCFSLLFAGQAGIILVWVHGAAFHLPMNLHAHTDTPQKSNLPFQTDPYTKKPGAPLSGAIFSHISEAA